MWTSDLRDKNVFCPAPVKGVNPMLKESDWLEENDSLVGLVDDEDDFDYDDDEDTDFDDDEDVFDDEFDDDDDYYDDEDDYYDDDFDDDNDDDY